jgi:hypothetical protein
MTLTLRDGSTNVAGRLRAAAYTKARVPERLQARAAWLADLTREELSQPGSGRVYGSHQASAPGQPPAPDTGALLRSVRVRRLGNGYPGVVWGGPTAPYARWLEYGTRTMRPRPVGRIALARYRQLIGQQAPRLDVRGRGHAGVSGFGA